MVDEASGLGQMTDLIGIDEVLSFIRQLVKVTLDATDVDLTTLSLKIHSQRISRFISDTTTNVVFIQKIKPFEDNSMPDHADAEETSTIIGSQYEYSISTELVATASVESTIALIKRGQVILAGKTLHSQIQTLNLPGANSGQDGSAAYEALHKLVKLAVVPYFNAFAKSNPEDLGVSKNGELSQGRKYSEISDLTHVIGVPSTKKKLAELEISLLHLQQNIDVPHILLAPHKLISQWIRDAQEDKKRPTVGNLHDQTALDDLATMNAIQATTVTWRQQIKQVTERDRDPHVGTASQEINFWLNLETVLTDVESQLKSDSISLTFDVLAAAKRLGINSAMIMQDTGFKDCREKVKSYNLLMRDLPLGDLLSSTSLEKAAEALEQVFDHLNRRLRTVPYPVARAIPLAENITADVERQILSHLNGQRLMKLDYENFEALIQAANTVFTTYDNKIKDFITTSRDVLRKRSEKFLVIKVNAVHLKVQERLTYLHHFRRAHEQLASTISAIMSPEAPIWSSDEAVVEQLAEIDAPRRITEAYALLRNVDVLDVSIEGTETWAIAEREYDERISGIETTVINLMRARLDIATSANEMFRVFATFNSLFVRPKIRGAIQEYQKQLIDGVKDDISRLQHKFNNQFVSTNASSVCGLRDIPLLSGHIIWTSQISRQLDSYMSKVETVLGLDWHLYAEGQKLQAESTAFRLKLDVKPLYDDWLLSTRQNANTMRGPIFSVQRNRADGNKLELFIYFDEKALTLFKEVRNLLHLGFSVPHQINTAAKSAKQVYPQAMSILDSKDIMTSTYHKMETLDGMEVLLASSNNEVQKALSDLSKLSWSSFKDDSGTSRRATQVVSRWATSVSGLHSKVDMLTIRRIAISQALKAIQACPYSKNDFLKYIQIAQDQINEVSLEGCSNLHVWIEQINVQLHSVLVLRARTALEHWIAIFTTGHDPKNESGLNLTFPALILEIILKNQVIAVDPPVAFAKAIWYSQLSSWLDVVTSLPRLADTRQEGLTKRKDISLDPVSFEGVASELADGLRAAQSHITRKAELVQGYVFKWLQFQSLWDLQVDQIWKLLGSDLIRWLQIIREVRKARSTFDTSSTRHILTHISIDFEQVQARVMAKYDSWQRDILAKFATILSDLMIKFYNVTSTTRRDLESKSLDTYTTASAVEFITAVQAGNNLINPWRQQMALIQQGNATLVRQRYHFASDWLAIERLEGEWTSLLELLERKNKLVTDQMEALQAKINNEDIILREQIQILLNSWTVERPLDGQVSPEVALSVLQSFAQHFEQRRKDLDMVAAAKDALSLDFVPVIQLYTAIEEAQDLSSVWSAANTVWVALEELKKTLWSTVVTRKVRSSLENLLSMSREMPARMRQYAAIGHMQSTLSSYVKENGILSDLRSEAIRERHWIHLYKLLRPKQRLHLASMTLGDVWSLRLEANNRTVREIIVEAEGQLALEEFIREVRETWFDYSVDLVNYQNKCRLIRGWDDLFAKSSEHLNALSAMRHSPHYKIFRDEATIWEDKLNKIHVLFDVWIDVQRQWLYLEGIFIGNQDIKHMLPMETTRFDNINNEFLKLMRQVYKSPSILDLINITGIQKTMDRLAEMLQQIQKALGEYLERERSSFPRFYFVGDEDLLEIIGNSKNIEGIQKHLKKMFAGIATLKMNDDQTSILAILSSEAEEISLVESVSLTRQPLVKDWLLSLEAGMRHSLAYLLNLAVQSFSTDVIAPAHNAISNLLAWIGQYPMQIIILASQCFWTRTTEEAILRTGQIDLHAWSQRLQILLQTLSVVVLQDLQSLDRAKCEALIVEVVHQREVVVSLTDSQICSCDDFRWLYHMRFYHSGDEPGISCVKVHTADTVLLYGFEYLGVTEKLVQTPLTDRCYLTLTQALGQKLGGSPFGPAGTGKTESVKALGAQLGRFVLVFCCDDAFDYQAMGRIFLGLCQVGAWGCFDEFNRLEERMLSAVSQQIQTIQLGLRSLTDQNEVVIELVGKSVRLNADTGIFITMNPGYAGRSHLPDNLKKLFRSFAMAKPDKELIARVIFYTQGFSHAINLASKLVPFFDMCQERMATQSHYDFGLRALKSVLTTCGTLKRLDLKDRLANSSLDLNTWETQTALQGLRESIAPRLVGSDMSILDEISQVLFPNVPFITAPQERLENSLGLVANRKGRKLVGIALEKCLQLDRLLHVHHGIMLVGSAGTGKSVTWQMLSEALHESQGHEYVTHTIDAKVMNKEALYGRLDTTTREWSDGLLTSILRRIIDNLRGEAEKYHWIVFDGDVDPEWVENMNSVLDDNKQLTLPNGERLNMPHNVRIIFEVENLKQATLATVSRCGMVYFNDDHVTVSSMLDEYLHRLCNNENTFFVNDLLDRKNSSAGVRAVLADCFKSMFYQHDLVTKALELAEAASHIMAFTVSRSIATLCALCDSIVDSVLAYNSQHTDFELSEQQIIKYVRAKFVLNLVWSFAGDCTTTIRTNFASRICDMVSIDLPEQLIGVSLIDYDVELPESAWYPWARKVPVVEIDPSAITSTNIVIPTTDTLRHESILYAWLAARRSFILCGPPGSGKTMTLFNALRKLPNVETVGLNFSSATSPDLVLKTLEQYCEYRKSINGSLMCPAQPDRWLILFCDEINLPARDAYGTQRVIAFLRQLIEAKGFWRTSDQTWINLERVQIVGACNPPSDVGRSPFSTRFLRHIPVLMVDYPAQASLEQIYGTFVRAALKFIPTLRGYSEALTAGMIELYLRSQAHFTTTQQSHYIYSPRELTRWVRGIAEAIKPLESLSVEELVRIWAHEAERLFEDRLVTKDERAWSAEAIKGVCCKHFPNSNISQALQRPILYSNWTSKHYLPVNQTDMRVYIRARLRTFCEEEYETSIIPTDEAIEHILKIDRVFKQPQGHLILIGVSGSGKTTLCRFVAWMNGLKTFQIKAHRKYSAHDFDEDLRQILRRCGTKNEKLCFILDEANVFDSAFLERMNTLLANAEIPGLFEGDEFSALMTACKESAQRDGQMLDNPEELYQWFTQQVVRNLHVVFTMNPPNDMSKKATRSPALFNRCVLIWTGDWSVESFGQVSSEILHNLDLDRSDYIKPPDSQHLFLGEISINVHRQAVINALISFHRSAWKLNQDLRLRGRLAIHIGPRYFLDMVHHFKILSEIKRNELEDQQRHLNVGLIKLEATVTQVAELRSSLDVKRTQLESKNIEANEKLQNMVGSQQEAEKKKIASLEIQEAIAIQEADIRTRRTIVINDLAQAEPAVLEAQQSVSNIKKQQLTEVRSMGNPPEAVKLAMESVCTLLGHSVEGWKSVQSVIRREDFISSIVRFDSEVQMNPALRVVMQRDYMTKPMFQYEAVNRASKACGPLVQWVVAQVSYSEILDKVGPLRQEVDALERDAILARKKANAMVEMIREIEESIIQYKADYADLISETQTIKNEMATVENKVARSLRLLASLTSERARWQDGSQAFKASLEALVGDVLLSAAFMAYSGFYEQSERHTLYSDWADYLRTNDIRYTKKQSISHYLASPDTRVRWQAIGMPTDNLCVENAVLLRDHVRYPLIIDPTGRATKFLLRNEQNEQASNIVQTSFLDDSFLKHLESAIRFGNSILINDAEYLDPILNKVLNREYQKTGGRTLVELGKHEIDVSPAFKLYLATRDPSVAFSPDVSSRVTFVNFSVTKASLTAQSLNLVLKSERPDVEEKQTLVLKAQGEYRTLLRKLERDLLEVLNNSPDNLLDDATVIETLEALKNNAEDISEKVANSESVMIELAAVSELFSPIANACGIIYSLLEHLLTLNHFYQFSIFYLEAVLKGVLAEACTDPRQDLQKRIDTIVANLYISIFRRASQSLRNGDRVTLATLLLLAKSDTLTSQPSISSALPSAVSGQNTRTWSSGELASYMAEVRSHSLPISLPESDVELDLLRKDVLRLSEPEQYISNTGSTDTNGSLLDLERFMLIRLFRHDRVIPALECLTATAFGKSFLQDLSYDIRDVVATEIDCKTPVLLCSSPGYDAAYKVDALAERVKANLASVAMGSSESIVLADRCLVTAAQAGTWVLLKNVHLAPAWLAQLEKRMYSLTPNQEFRLFLTMETNHRVPSSLIRMSRVLMFEAPPGIRANMTESFKSLYRLEQAIVPAEKARLYFLLSWLHAIVQERARYATIGWTKRYDFNDSDFDSARFAIDSWLTTTAAGRVNIAPEKIPWRALQTLLIDSFYGGQIDHEPDHLVLGQLVMKFFTPKAYEIEYFLVDTQDDKLRIPDVSKLEEFATWIKTLPEREPPTWLGLEADAQELLLAKEGERVLSDIECIRARVAEASLMT